MSGRGDWVSWVVGVGCVGTDRSPRHDRKRQTSRYSLFWSFLVSWVFEGWISLVDLCLILPTQDETSVGEVTSPGSLVHRETYTPFSRYLDHPNPRLNGNTQDSYTLTPLPSLPGSSTASPRALIPT